MLLKTFLLTLFVYTAGFGQINTPATLSEKPNHLVIQKALFGVGEPYIYHFDDETGISVKIEVKQNSEMDDATFEIMFGGSIRTFCDGVYEIKKNKDGVQYIYFDSINVCINEKGSIVLVGKENKVSEEKAKEIASVLREKMVLRKDSPHLAAILESERLESYDDAAAAINDSLERIYSPEEDKNTGTSN